MQQAVLIDQIDFLLQTNPVFLLLIVRLYLFQTVVAPVQKPFVVLQLVFHLVVFAGLHQQALVQQLV